MRLVSLQQLASSLLLVTVAVHALPSKSRPADTAVEKREAEDGLQNAGEVDFVAKRAPTADSPPSAQVTTLPQPVPILENELLKHAKDTGSVVKHGKGVGKRGPDAYAVEKSDKEEYEMLDDDNDYGHRRGDPPAPAPAPAPKPKKSHKHSTRSLDEERTARLEHSAKVRRENIKRLYQDVSAFQEYRNRIPPSAYAADDGSFDHAITHRDTTAADHAKRGQTDPAIASHFQRRRSMLIARLKELGYDPKKMEANTDAGAPEPDSRTKHKRDLATTILERSLSKRYQHPAKLTRRAEPNPKKRDIEVHIGCPSLRLMNSVSLTFFNPDSFKDDMYELRNRCFNCGCKAMDRGWFMIERPDYQCTKQLIQTCYIMGCMCTEQFNADSHFLVGKPNWKEGVTGDRDATFEIDEYDPGTDQLYGDSYAAEAAIHEEILKKKAKRDPVHVARDESLHSAEKRPEPTGDELPEGTKTRILPDAEDIDRDFGKAKKADGPDIGPDDGGWVPVIDKRAGQIKESVD
ncbi:hypothetical protein TWF696_005836 [Orbilia brochopaga]|uniref:Uncharacterized protein n=1 Tax=Orbilia brochopaga TaxID=3140254 RepID=A0AAV9UYD8_9PEZI